MLESRIRSVAVLGAGTMGLGIAHVAALGGFTTRLYDVAEEALAKARKTIERNLAKGVEKGKVEAEAAQQSLERLTATTRLEEAAEGADLVIEAVPESMSLKIEIFQQLARLTPPETLLATNTSSLSVTEMAAASGRPQRFAGMHFFNPVHLMKLVEMVRGLETSEETLSTLSQVAEAMGKTVVTVRDVPGFVTSRINVLIGNEAFRMLESGVASAEDIDQALKLGLNHPMGPFEMADLVGLDVRYAILQFLHSTLGDAFRPTNLMTQYVRAGRLGRKTGRGVYTYDENGKRLPS